jgi:hypothetical protein
VPEHGGYAFRYKEKSLDQAIVQKLARVVSGLGAANVLLQNGFTQELAVLQRTLDELCEDIFFLCLPLHGEPRSALHDSYLASFYEEEFNEKGDPKSSPQRREMVPRKKIRAALANCSVAPINPSDHIQIHRTLYKAYSGYVHGASPQIMDMYIGDPPRFWTDGMLGTQRVEAAQQDFWHYVYRGLTCQLQVAMCLRLHDVGDELQIFKASFEARSGSWR